MPLHQALDSRLRENDGRWVIRPSGAHQGRPYTGQPSPAAQARSLSLVGRGGHTGHPPGTPLHRTPERCFDCAGAPLNMTCQTRSVRGALTRRASASTSPPRGRGGQAGRPPGTPLHQALDSRLRENDGRWVIRPSGTHKGCPYTGHPRGCCALKRGAALRSAQHDIKGWRRWHQGWASMRMKAMMQGAVPRLFQLWTVARWTRTSPACRCTSTPSSSSMSISPEITTA